MCPLSTPATIVDYHNPDIVSHSDYYAFGANKPGTQWTSLSNPYKYTFNGKEKDGEAISTSGGDQDYGMRIYNPSLGRWLSIDPLSKNYANQSPHSFCINNPIKFIDSEGRFVVDPVFKEMYPKVALILENAELIYFNKELPVDVQKALEGTDYKAIFTDVFKQAFQEFSTLSDEQIVKTLKNGSGPRILADNTDQYDPQTDKTTLVNGRVDNINGENLDAVIEGDKQGVITIDDDVVEVIEFELNPGNNKLSGFGGKTTSNKDKKSAFKSFISTVFHEAVHVGRQLTGQFKKDPKAAEKGKEFENKALGEDVKRVKKKMLKMQRTKSIFLLFIFFNFFSLLGFSQKDIRSKSCLAILNLMDSTLTKKDNLNKEVAFSFVDNVKSAQFFKLNDEVKNKLFQKTIGDSHRYILLNKKYSLKEIKKFKPKSGTVILSVFSPIKDGNEEIVKIALSIKGTPLICDYYFVFKDTLLLNYFYRNAIN
jgi:RHS repeat-associated protein